MRSRAHLTNANWRTDVTKRTSAKYKLDRRMGENVFGRPKSPVNRREYGPGQHGQRRKGKVSDYRHPAARQAEAQGLLRRHHRKAVQAELYRGQRDEGRRLAEPHRPARAPARHGRLSRQVRADDLGRAPAGQPRPHPGQRRQVQHRLAPGERRRRHRARPQGAGNGAGDRGAGPRRARHPRLRRARRHVEGRPTPACPSSTRCPIRCGWSPTS